MIVRRTSAVLASSKRLKSFAKDVGDTLFYDGEFERAARATIAAVAKHFAKAYIEAELNARVYADPNDPGAIRACIGGGDSALTPHEIYWGVQILEFARNAADLDVPIEDLDVWRTHFSAAAKIIEDRIAERKASEQEHETVET